MRHRRSATGAAAATAAALSAQGLSAEGHEVDLSDPEAARHWVQTSIAALGGIDVLYNNASLPAVAPFTSKPCAAYVNVALDAVGNE